jgi:hypothetical protein
MGCVNAETLNSCDILQLDADSLRANMFRARAFVPAAHRVPMLVSLLPIALSALLSVLQSEQAQPTPDPQLERAWQRWEQFDAEDHLLMGAAIESYVFESEHPKLKAFAALRKVENGPKVLEKADLLRFSADEYAPKLKLKTKTIKRKERSWARFAQHSGIDPDARPERSWRWSSGRQALLPPEREALKPRARIESLLRGQLPDIDHWIARLEAELDHDSVLQEAANYFEHAYRDRDGNFYEGLRLADLWATQREFGISDVEAIAFLREFLGDDSIESPIPSRLHNGIYALIRDQYAELREAEQLRRALAASFFDATEQVPLVLRSVAPRFDLAWALVGDDPARMATWLKEHSSRKAFLGSVEMRIADWLRETKRSEDELRARSGPWRAQLATRAREAMRREGLFGFRGR